MLPTSVVFFPAFVLSSTFAGQPPVLSVNLDAIENILKSSEFSKNSEWENSSEVRVSDAVFDTSRIFLKKYCLGKIPFDYGPDPEGSLSFSWYDIKKNYVYLSVRPDNQVHLFYRTIKFGRWEGISESNSINIRSIFRRVMEELELPGSYNITLTSKEPEIFVFSFNIPSDGTRLLAS